MSFIQIMKYSEPDGTAKNYFDHPTFVDKLETDRIMLKGFPDFTEEANYGDDILTFQASDFSIMFSLLQTETSSEGKSIKEFLKPDDGKFYLFAVKVTFPNKTFGGLIDFESITVNYTIAQQRYDIKFKIYGFDKEFKDACGEWKYSGIPWHATFDSFVQNWLFWGTNGSNLKSDYFTVNVSHLNFISRLGYTPILIQEMAKTAGYTEAGLYECESCWDIFLDICKGLGIAFKFRVNPVQKGSNYLDVELVLFFRTTGLTERETPLVIEWEEQNTIRGTNKFVAVTYEFNPATFTNGTPPLGIEREPYHVSYDGPYAGLILDNVSSFINDCEGVENYESHTVIGSAHYHSYRKKIIFEGKEQPDPRFQKINIEDVKIIYGLKFHTFYAGRNYPIGPWVFHNHPQTQDQPSFARLFVKNYTEEHSGMTIWTIIDEGWYEIVAACPLVEYKVLLGGYKNKLNLKIHFDENTALEINDTILWGDAGQRPKKYWLERLKNINLYEKTADTEWIEC